jgi:hypothetical protein
MPSIPWRGHLALLGPLIDPTVDAVVMGLLAQYGHEPEARLAVRGVADKINLMPTHIGIPIALLTLALEGLCRLRFLRPTGRLSATELRHLLGWVQSFPGPGKDLVLVYERLAAFVYFSILEFRGGAEG